MWNEIKRWLLRPSEFTELQQADRALEILAPLESTACALCRFPLWASGPLNSLGVCTWCWDHGSGHWVRPQPGPWRGIDVTRS